MGERNENKGKNRAPQVLSNKRPANKMLRNVFVAKGIAKSYKNLIIRNIKIIVHPLNGKDTCIFQKNADFLQKIKKFKIRFFQILKPDFKNRSIYVNLQEIKAD